VEVEIVAARAAFQEERKNGNEGSKREDYMVEVNPPQW
jgi:hypothetical protein